MNVTVGVPIRGRKVQQVLEGARVVFMRDGFEGASVDEIARVSKVSKATLYSYFSDKRLMFLEVAKAECYRQAEHAGAFIEHASSIEDALRLAAQNMVEFLTSKVALSVFRICVAESDRFPELGEQFYRCGPMKVRERIVALMKMGIDRGELRIDDVDLAADQFAELCKVDIFPRILFCRCGKPGPEQIARVIDGAVETFMARYGVQAKAG